jgi:hypothetical protein
LRLRPLSNHAADRNHNPTLRRRITMSKAQDVKKDAKKKPKKSLKEKRIEKKSKKDK